MTTALQHRGPDGEGFYYSHDCHGGVALGHRRLSIIDLEGGKQPLSNEDGSVWTVFNGEIYNFQELRGLLEKRGHVFRTHSDTEVLVHLYEDYGSACVEHLRGMFAFAIWDARQQSLFLARDRLGKKPLYYVRQPEHLLFASELHALRQAPGINWELDPEGLDQYLRYLYIPHPRTIYQHAKKLPPGHCATYHNGQLTVRRYWELDYSEHSEISPEEYRSRLRETLTDATRLRMISDVPVGAFLSGGIDSTTIVGLMCEVSSVPVTAFSMGFSSSSFDETPHAREVAKRLGVDHHVFVVTPNLMDIVPKLVWQYDEPFGDSSAIPTYYLSEHTRQHVTVALTGDGGDELFAGYHWYRTLRMTEWFDRLPWLGRMALSSRAWQRIPCPDKQANTLRRLKALLSMLNAAPEERYQRVNRAFCRAELDNLYTDDFRTTIRQQHTEVLASSAFHKRVERDLVTRASFADLESYLAADILVKVDIASMAHGLECRSPFLDHHVVELAARMPISLKMHGLRGKQILRETFPDILPTPMWQRKKMGFCLPLGEWLRGPLKSLCQEVLLDPETLGRGYFRRAAVERLLAQHLRGDWDHSARLWALLVLEFWHRLFVDETRASDVHAQDTDWRDLNGSRYVPFDREFDAPKIANGRVR